MFVNREQELAFLDSIWERGDFNPAQFILLYGRRRVGKTALLRHWAERSGLPYIYWSAEKGPAALQRREFYARVVGINLSEAPVFESWANCWRAIATHLADRRCVLILDEVNYAANVDSTFLSSLQHAWDQYFKASSLLIVLCGSHVHTMEMLLNNQSPLFGRFTGQWHLQPLPFAALQEFFPTWSMEERVALYAIVGGIPAYLEWLNPKLTFQQNIHRVVLAPGSMFVSETSFLLYDELVELGTYLAIIKAIGTGSRTMGEISDTALVSTTHVPAYLARLQELYLVERRLAVTIPPAKRRRAKTSRYHLADPYFRFYFRFIHPFRDELAYRREQFLPQIHAHLRDFVGVTAFEELSRQWVVNQSRRGRLPFLVQEVGSHWSSRPKVQIDVVAVNWPKRQILLGECKWRENTPISRAIIRELIEKKTPKVLKKLPGKEWAVHYAFFSRAGFTEAARSRAEESEALLVDLDELEAGLREEN